MVCLIEAHKWCVLLKHTISVRYWSTQVVCLIEAHKWCLIEVHNWCAFLKHTNGVFIQAHKWCLSQLTLYDYILNANLMHWLLFIH